MENKKMTMSDIAKIAGVAKSTVSRYFNGGYVKEETKQKLKKIIDEYHYEPNAVAQSLKAKRSYTVGIVAPCLDSITSSRMLMAIDEYLKNQGYTTIIINTNHNEMRELASIEHLWRMNVDGIILLATAITMTHQQIANKLDIPILFVAQLFKGGISIIYDDYHAGYDIGQYAAQMGHQNILYFGVPNKDEAVGVQRKKGVLDALSDAHITNITIKETEFSFYKSRKIIKEYLEKHQPSLIICATDNIALACYKEIQEKGLKVPDDISLIGFGGYEISSLVTPSLCTIRFDNELAGQMAGKTIIQLIDKEMVAPTQLIGYQLIKGGSVKKKHSS